MNCCIRLYRDNMSKSEFYVENIAIPPTDLFERKMLKQTLTVEESKQLYDFLVSLTYLEDYGSPTDIVSIEYIAQFFNYLCKKYDNYLSLPNELKSSYDVAYYSGENSFMSAAYRESNCPDSFMDNIITEV